MQSGNGMRTNDIQQIVAGHFRGILRQDKRGSADERGINFLGRSIKADGNVLQHAIVRLQIVFFLHGQCMVEQ